MALHPLQHALRTARRSPGFAAAVVATLTLAVGANTAVFALVNAILLRPMPGVRQAEALVNVHATAPGGDELGGFSHPDYRDLRGRTSALVDVAAFHGRGMSLAGG